MVSCWFHQTTRVEHAFLVGGFNPSEKYARQIGSFLQIGMNIKNIWNHHLDFHILRFAWKRKQTIFPKWWWKKVIYHGRIRKKSPYTNTSIEKNSFISKKDKIKKVNLSNCFFRIHRKNRSSSPSSPDRWMRLSLPQCPTKSCWPQWRWRWNVQTSVSLGSFKSLEIQSSCQRMMIGVSNHLRNAKYLGSMKPFSEGESGSLGNRCGLKSSLHFFEAGRPPVHFWNLIYAIEISEVFIIIIFLEGGGSFCKR